MMHKNEALPALLKKPTFAKSRVISVNIIVENKFNIFFLYLLSKMHLFNKRA